MSYHEEAFAQVDCEALLRLLGLSRPGFGATERTELLLLFNHRSWYVDEFRLASIALLSKSPDDALAVEWLFDQALGNHPRLRRHESPAARLGPESGIDEQWWTSYVPNAEEPQEPLSTTRKSRDWVAAGVLVLAVLTGLAALFFLQRSK